MAELTNAALLDLRGAFAEVRGEFAGLNARLATAIAAIAAGPDEGVLDAATAAEIRAIAADFRNLEGSLPDLPVPATPDAPPDEPVTDVVSEPIPAPDAPAAPEGDPVSVDPAADPGNPNPVRFE